MIEPQLFEVQDNKMHRYINVCKFIRHIFSLKPQMYR